MSLASRSPPLPLRLCRFVTRRDPRGPAADGYHIGAYRESPREAADMDPDLNPERLVGKLDDLVAPAAEPENAVLVDRSRLVRLGRPVVRAVFRGDAAVDRVHRAVAAVPPAVAQLRHRVGRVRRPAGRRAGQLGGLRAAPVPPSVRRRRRRSRDLGPARGRCLVRLHDHAGQLPLGIDRVLLLGGAAAGGVVPVAELSHRAGRRAADPDPAAPAQAVSPSLTPDGTRTVSAPGWMLMTS